MATQTYTPVLLTKELGVMEYYNQLMKESVGKDSLYIRTKETLEAMFKDGQMKDPDKSAIIGKALVDITVQLSAQAMNTALAIAKEERDAVYTLTKLKEDTLLVQANRQKISADIDNSNDAKISAVSKQTIDGWKVQADMRSDNGLVLTGLNTLVNKILPETAFKAKGSKYEQTQQMKSSVYATFAKSFRESGVVSWSLDPNSGKVASITDVAPTTPGLTKAQENVAIRQKTAFDDNMVQHSANSSANMIGLLLSSNQQGNITLADATKWRTAVNYLNKPTI
jgi:hypothetical protein